jgi:hypothetical protein
MTNKMVERITRSFESQSMMKTWEPGFIRSRRGRSSSKHLYFLQHYNSRAMAMQD